MVLIDCQQFFISAPLHRNSKYFISVNAVFNKFLYVFLTVELGKLPIPKEVPVNDSISTMMQDLFTRPDQHSTPIKEGRPEQKSQHPSAETTYSSDNVDSGDTAEEMVTMPEGAGDTAGL